jgi:hypothetical protein
VLVTGRTFFDLTRVCDRLELFDTVVAENGAVLYWPRSQTLRDQAPAPSPRLLAELDRRGITYQAGRVVVDTARTNEPSVRRRSCRGRLESVRAPSLQSTISLDPVAGWWAEGETTDLR